jgi:hypothetical protein
MTRRSARFSAFLGLAALLPGASACSFSYSSQSFSDSSKSSSESVSGSSRSSSGSSSPEQERAAVYQQDVADYTEAYVVSGGSDAGFLRGVGDIARQRGVNDWESEQVTWEGIGRGLARLELSEVQIEVYKSNWSGGDSAKMESIERGYDAER